MNRFLLLTALILPLSAITACSDKIQSEAKYPTGIDRSSAETNDIYADAPSIFGDGGILGERKETNNDTITVNSYLWRAALDTISFMPIELADPFGGTILTGWYSAPESPNEQIKMNVLVLGKQLKATGVKVNVFKQQRSGGRWVDAQVDPSTGRKLEDAILTRARQYRIQDDE